VGGSGSQPKGRVTKTGQFARYSVRLLAYPFDGTCSVAPSDFGFTALETNRAGNVRTDRFFTPDQVPAEIRNANHGVRWVVTLNGVVVYQTGCEAVALE